MFNTQVFRVSLAVVCLAAAGYPDEKQISIADCRYAGNPDEFLSRQSRIYHRSTIAWP